MEVLILSMLFGFIVAHCIEDDYDPKKTDEVIKRAKELLGR